tara:strand:+ start:1947 stop:2171 length:225 start_codon:yes stop_codon:yes gene_type:complete
MNALKVGDLLQLKKHCKKRNRWAIVSALPLCRDGLITITYLDTRETGRAAKSNIEVYSDKEFNNGPEDHNQKTR